jgi:hypothetical protein
MATKKPAPKKPAPHPLPPVDSSRLDQEALQAIEKMRAYLTEPIPGPPGVVYYLRGFRELLLFASVCVAGDKYPPLTRCWKELETLFLTDPLFDDEMFVQAWILFDFPFGPKGETVLDYFHAEMVAGREDRERLRAFVEGARKSRLGLWQDTGRTEKVSRFRELFTGKTVAALRSVDEYGPGEIFLVRMIEHEGEVFLFGDPKGFPRETKGELEGMVARKMRHFFPGKNDVERYTTMMKLAGPYWMSCVTKNEDVDILDPDHHLTYLQGGR